MFADLNTIRYLWPEAILVLCAAWIYLGGAIRPVAQLVDRLRLGRLYLAAAVIVCHRSG